MIKRNGWGPRAFMVVEQTFPERRSRRFPETAPRASFGNQIVPFYRGVDIVLGHAKTRPIEVKRLYLDCVSGLARNNLCLVYFSVHDIVYLFSVRLMLALCEHNVFGKRLTKT